jgi:hypothetical protein
MPAGVGFMEGLLGRTMGVVGKAAFYGVKGAWSVANEAGAPAMHAAFALGTPAVKAATVGAAQATRFGFAHPEVAMGIGAAGLGVYALSQTGAGQRDMNEDEMAQLARMTGSSTGFAPGEASYHFDPRRMAFIDSTYGLSLGLHRGRHG